MGNKKFNSMQFKVIPCPLMPWLQRHQAISRHTMWNEDVLVFHNSSPPGKSGCHFGRQHFQMHFFLEWQWQNSDSNFTEICFQESNWHYASIGSGNDLAPNRQQAITATNDGLVNWRIYAALGGDELMTSGILQWHFRQVIFKLMLLIVVL